MRIIHLPLLVSIPFSTIKRLYVLVRSRGRSEFQFHLVRLKAIPVKTVSITSVVSIPFSTIKRK